jgi:hypothetical protein
MDVYLDAESKERQIGVAPSVYLGRGYSKGMSWRMLLEAARCV